MTKEIITTNEIRDLTLKVDKLIDKDNVYMQIATRGADPNAKELMDFKTFDDKKLALVAERMPAINRATQSFGKQNSQATGKLMSLHMIAQSPYRRMKQCLAKIERKRSALKENIFKLRREKVKLDKLLRKRILLIDKELSIDGDDVILHDLDIEDINIKIEKIATGISDSTLYIEGALKEIGMYQEAYEEIRTSFNISEQWDELDMERAEIEEHVKTSFLHAVRDVMMTGRLNVGTIEYLEQYGVNPNTAYTLVVDYLGTSGNNTNITTLYDFLDRMYDTFKDEYKLAMKRLGIKTLISEDFLYLEDKTEEDKDE